MHPDLSPTYYLSNFQRVLADVAQRYDDLLNVDERAFLDAVAALGTSAQALLVRLVMRTRDVVDRDSLRYPEIDDIPAALAELAAAGLVSVDAPIRLDELFALATRAELLAGLAAEGLHASQRKSAMRAALAHLNGVERRLGDWLQDTARTAVRLRVRAEVDTCRWLFFGNLHQDWSAFVVADLGHLRYETVPFSADSRGFATREDLLVSRRLHALRTRLAAGEGVADLVADLPTEAEASGPLSRARLNKCLFLLGQAAERTRDWPLAESLLTRCGYRGARHRLMRVQEQQGQWQAAHDTALAILAAPASDAEWQATWRAMPRLTRKLGLPTATPPRLRAPPVRAFQLAAAPAICVEVSVAEHLRSASRPVHYVENTLFTSVFGLLFWEVLFAPVPGAFFNAFQVGPADLFHPTFAAAREALINRAFAHLEAPGLREHLLARWQAKRGIQNPFVSWGHVDEALIDLAVSHIPPAHWAVVFRRLLTDLKAHRSGFPDLIALTATSGPMPCWR